MNQCMPYMAAKVQLDGCIVWNAHNKLFVSQLYPMATIHQGYRQTDRQTSRLVFTVRLCRQFRTPPVQNAPKLRSLHAAAPTVQSEYPAERRAAAAVPLPESP